MTVFANIFHRERDIIFLVIVSKFSIQVNSGHYWLFQDSQPKTRVAEAEGGA
jgi:hypothetical protein